MEKYFLIATLSSIAFYAIYHCFLRKESFHQFNRIYLLSALMVSLLIPLVRFSIVIPAAENASASNLSEWITAIQLPEITVTASSASLWSMTNLFWKTYIIGLIISAVLFIIKLCKIGLLIIKSQKRRCGIYIYVKYDETIAPFSFFNFIFINQDAYNEEDGEQIVLHEQIHVRQRHSWDLIFTELLGILFWFNPILLLYKRSLQVIHEYLADHRVLQHGIEQGAYLNLLLRQLTLQNINAEALRATPLLGHHFNYLLTKNRFKMLKNNRYSKWALAKSVYVLPFIAFLLMLNCNPKPQEPETVEYTFELPASETGEAIAYDIEITDEGTNQKEIKIKKADKEEGKPDANGVCRFVEVMPEPIGGLDAMYKFLQENLKYPAEAREQNIQGQVFLEFVVEKDGSIANVKVLKGIHTLLDEEAMRAVKLMPNWKPGTQNGVPVRTYYQIPVKFTIN
jgi:TonB family protein